MIREIKQISREYVVSPGWTRTGRKRRKGICSRMGERDCIIDGDLGNNMN